MTKPQFLLMLFLGILTLVGTLATQFVHGGIMYLPSLYVLVLVTLMTIPLLKQFDIFAPVTLVAGMHLGFVLGALVIMSSDMTLFYVNMDVSGRGGAQLLSRALLYVVLGLSCYYLGYYAVIRGVNIREWLSRPLKSQRDLMPEVYWLVAMYAVAGIGSYYFFYVRPMGGVGNLVRLFGRSTQLEMLHEATGASSLGTRAIAAAQLLWFSHYPGSRKGRFLFWMYSALVLAIQILSARIFSNVVTLGLCLVIWHRYSASGRKVKTRMYILAGITIVAMALAVYGYRYASRTRRTDLAGKVVAEVFTPRGFAERIVKGANVPDVNILIQITQGVPKRIPFQYGKTFLPFTVQVAAMLREQWYGGIGGARPPTILGELYMNFGFPGIIGGMLLFGVSCGYLYKWMMTSQDRWAQFVYSIVVVLVAVLVKGEITTIVITAAWWIVPVVATVFGVRLLRYLTFSTGRFSKRGSETRFLAEKRGAH